MQDHQRIPERMFWRGMHGVDSLVESMFCEVARAVGASVHIMIVDRKVEREAQARRMPWRQRAERMFIRGLVGFQSKLRSPLSLLMSSKFSKVSIIIALPLYASPARPSMRI